MADGPYTVNDSPAVVRRIESDLSHILEVVRRADPHLRALVLTGGFARGEGATLAGVPQNDYDLIAFRAIGRPGTPYQRLRAELEADLGLHVDLAPVALWRVGLVPRSIFWYETALRGRVLWGQDVLGRIPLRDPQKIKRTEALRLLVNRAAGLLFATQAATPNQRRLQAAKALLAVMDSRLLAMGVFPPSQTERWAAAGSLVAGPSPPASLRALAPWFEWAFRFKVDPANAPERDEREAWSVAARSILDAVPEALRHAELGSLEEYGLLGDLIERTRYFFLAPGIPGARRFAAHPTGSVRVATLRLLGASLDGAIPSDAAHRMLGSIAHVGNRPLDLLEALRTVTVQ